MTKKLKSTGVIFRQENGCTLSLIIGKWNNAAKKPDYHWLMESSKTGKHQITTQSNRPDERVDSHWKGFLLNQQESAFKDTMPKISSN